jgi:hypothetical protein
MFCSDDGHNAIIVVIFSAQILYFLTPKEKSIKSKEARSVEPYQNKQIAIGNYSIRLVD